MKQKEHGFSEIVLTPHYIEGYYEKNEELRKELIKKLENELKEEKIKLYSGNEIYLSENIVKLLQNKKASSINDTRYVLFELPRSIKPMNLNNVIYEMLEQNYTPILAHPERYEFVYKEPEIICELIQKGVLMQSNYGSFVGQYGKKAETMAKKLLEEDMIHLLGTDTHRQNGIYRKIPQIIEKINKIVSETKQKELTEINPSKILKNEEINIKEPKEIKFTFKEKMIMRKV